MCEVALLLILLLLWLFIGNSRAQTNAAAPIAPIAVEAAATPVAEPTPVAVMRSLRIPITIDYLALGAAMKQQLYIDNGRAPLWNGSDQCEYFYAENPRFGRTGNNITLETDGSLMIGVMIGGNCVSPIVWNGIIEATTAPYMAPNLQLKFRVTDINLYDRNHQKTLLVGKGFDLIKQYYIPKMEMFTFDLSPAFHEFEELVKAGAPPEVTERVAKTLASLKAEPQLSTEDNGLRAILDLTVPPFEPLPTPSAPVQLTAAELAAFEKNLDQWDAFLVFAIKQMGDSSKDAQLRDSLLALLLDSRYRLIDALTHPQAAGPDPIRILFLEVWNRLGEIIRQAARRGTLGSQGLQFLSFMSAGDALFALDQAAPALGMRISTADLLRLAKLITPPGGTANPLAFSFEEDPELRKMFHVKEPLASEGPLDTESKVVETPTASPAASPTAAATASPSIESSAAVSASVSSTPAETSSALAPSPTTTSGPLKATSPPPESSPQISPSPMSFWRVPLWVFTPDVADAAEDAPQKSDLVSKLQGLAKKLKRAIVTSSNADDYRGDYEQLLRYGAQREIGEENIDYRFRPLYLRLVKSAAWQESCWRQFVLKGNRVTYLESSTHDLGLMQVNKYVWRGFYNIDRLEWDVLYNASTGMEILARLLDSTETKRGAFSPRSPDELARSVYAAYNGGPGSYRRWRAPEPKALRAIDHSFWEKYEAVLHGKHIDILSCAAEWGAEH